MTSVSSPYLSKSFVLGAGCLALVAFGYLPVVNYFYYGGGWPFIQIVFLAIYVVGFRQVRRSEVPRWLKWTLYVAPVVWMTAVTQWDALVQR